jgi:hypothetical protein
LLHALADALDDGADIGVIDAAMKRPAPPDANDIRPFVVVSAANQNVVDLWQLRANRLDRRILQPNQIDRDNGDPLPLMCQHDAAGIERIMHACRLAVHAIAGDIDRPRPAQLGRDIDGGKAGPQVALRRQRNPRRNQQDGHNQRRDDPKHDWHSARVTANRRLYRCGQRRAKAKR